MREGRRGQGAPARGPSVEEARAAARGLAGVLNRTPLLPLGGEDAEGIWLKPECLQTAGSFKIRGVFHAVSRVPAERRARGLSTVSAGNTAQALAWTGRHLGVAAKCLMPSGAPETKIRAVRALGGVPVLVPVEEVFRFLQERGWEREPEAFVHPWIDRDLQVGHGTLALEILDELPDVDTVFVPVGGGGLLGGVGSVLRAARPEVRIVAVEPEGCPSLHDALSAGRPVTVSARTICDGVAVPYVTEEMFPLLSELADEVVLVSEARVRDTVRRLATREHLVAEGAGALALAAALARPAGERGRTVCLVTGGSIDEARLAEILSE